MTYLEYILLTLCVFAMFGVITIAAGVIGMVSDRLTRRKYEDTHAIHPNIKDYDGGE